MKLRLTFEPRRQRIQPGWPGAVAAVALALCAGFYFSILQPAEQRRDAARHSASSLEKRIAQMRADSDERPPLQEQLAAFYRNFPTEQDATDTVGKIAAIAKRDGLALQQAEYKVERDKNGKLTRFEMSLPLKGDYKTIRRFLSDVSAEMQTVSLEQVQFERQKVGDPVIDAKVSLVMYLGKPS